MTTLSFLLFLLLSLVVSQDLSATWRLTSDEIITSRFDYTRNDISDYSTGNTVTPLIDGQNAMGRLYDDIEATVEGDYIYSSFFTVDNSIMLRPELSSYSNLVSTLLRALSRGVTVRILGNFDLLVPSESEDLCSVLNGQSPRCCQLETRFHSNCGSAHNKYWIIQRRGETVAIVGGMDMAAGRWDTQFHNNSLYHQEEPSDTIAYYGWHDTMFYIQGPAIYDMTRNFWHHWNDPKSPNPLAAVEDLFQPSDRYDYVLPTVLTGGGMDLQLLLTLGCQGAVKDGYYQNFAPHGEYSFLSGFTKMVSNAKNYLFLVDQFMYYNEAVQIVANALPNIKQLIILTDNANAFDLKVKEILGTYTVDELANYRNYYQYNALSLLTQNSTLAPKVHVFQLMETNYSGPYSELTSIYVHSKLYMADDEYAIFGSHGIERVGFTNDIELSFGVFDAVNISGPYSWVGRLRRNIWGELLHLSENDTVLMNPLDGIQEWIRQANLGNRTVRNYWPQNVGWEFYYGIIYDDIYSIDGRCSGMMLGGSTLFLLFFVLLMFIFQ